MTEYRAPIRYGISGISPTRISGSMEPPYRLINFNPAAGVVWLSDNPGLSVGQGTPLNPGTSFRWERPGELWAISESATGTEIILTTELDDWQPDPAAVAIAILNSGVLIVDNPKELFSDFLDAGNGFDSGSIDLTRYQSLTIECFVNALGGGNLDGLRIQFQPTATTTPGIDYYAHDIEFTGVGQVWVATIPVVNAYVKLISHTSTEIFVSVFGSHRPQESIAQRIFGTTTPNGPTNDLLLQTIGTIAAGASAVLPTLSPWYGDVEIAVIGLHIAANVFRMLIARRDPATGAFTFFDEQVIPAIHSNNKYLRTRYTLAGGSIRISLNAFTSEATSVRIRVTPVSGFTSVA